MWLPRGRLKQQIDDWNARGLLSEEQSVLLRDDVDARPQISFGSVAVMLGAVCICFAAMSFVAANWDIMSRLMRMSVLGAGMAVSYAIAGWLTLRGYPKFSSAFVLMGCGIFGAAIMFVSQMYHLTGPPQGGVLLWCLGCLAAAAFLRSLPAAVLGIALATLWAGMDMIWLGEVNFWYLPLWLAFAGLAWFWRSVPLAHLCALGLTVWQFYAMFQAFEEASVPIGLALSLVGIALLLWGDLSGELLRGFERDAVIYLLIAYFGYGLMWWFEFGRNYSRFDIDDAVLLACMALAIIPAVLAVITRGARLDFVMCAIWIVLSIAVVWLRSVPFLVEAVGLGVSIWTIRMGGRITKPLVMWLGYLSFALVMLAIYFEAAGGLLSTSVFYLGAGLLLLVGTWAAPRVAGLFARFDAS